MNLEQKARAILNLNLIKTKLKGKENKPIIYTCPDKNVYPFQRLEDSCLHVIINSHINIDMAKAEFESLFLKQNQEGYFMQINFWNMVPSKSHDSITRFYNRTESQYLTIIPLIAQALRAIYSNAANRNYLELYLPKISKYYDYLYDTRIFPGKDPQLLNIIHPSEGFIEGNPIYYEYSTKNYKEHVSKGIKSEISNNYINCLSDFNHNISSIKKSGFFLYKDLLFNALFIQGCRDLAFLYDKIGNYSERKKFLMIAKKLEKILIKSCWNPDLNLFFGINEGKSAILCVKSAISLTPLILDELPLNLATSLIEDHLCNENEFWTKNPVPLVSIDEKLFPMGDIHWWRNSSRVVVNWLIIKGLLKHGFINEANELIQKTSNLIDKCGFREGYHPNKDIGYGAQNFTRATLILDLIYSLQNKSNDSDFIMDKEWTRIKRLPDF